MIKFCLYSVASFFSVGALLAAHHYSGGAHLQFMGESLGLVIVLLSCQICFHLNGVDELLADSKTQIFLQKALKAAGVGLFLAGLLFYVFPRVSPGYAMAAASACFLTFAFVVLSPLVRSVAVQAEAPAMLIIGSQAATQRVYAQLAETGGSDNVRIADYSDLPLLAKQGPIARVIIADGDIQQNGDVLQTLLDLKFRGVLVENAVDSFERANRKIWIEGLSGGDLVFAQGFGTSPVYVSVKRVLDIVLSVMLLIVTAPLMAVIAIAIKLESAGPVIFSQQRVGFRGGRFTVHKFRSMRGVAE
jgi:hypothetical protein